MNDLLGERMKQYERETGSVLPPNSWSVLRLDGKAFHTYTKNLEKPYDIALMGAMVGVMKFLCENISSAVFGYTQSDEISIILTDTQSERTQLWFGGKVQKIVSVAAGYASAKFNKFRPEQDLAVFDARVFTLPSQPEVVNYLCWRQMDCMRNALFLAASEYYSHKELHGKTRDEKISMLAEAGREWPSRYPKTFTLGVQCKKVYKPETVSYTRKDTGATDQTNVLRAHWEVTPATEYQGVQLCELLSSEPQHQ